MAEGRLTTHVLDTALGRPAAGMKITLYRLGTAAPAKLGEAVTNGDGRTSTPMLAGAALQPGVYELVFKAGDYLRETEQIEPGVSFLDEIPIRFGIRDAKQHYHVPLLLSPFAYSTYRGS
jgi:5-hydroxyisourate hydrolase